MVEVLTLREFFGWMTLINLVFYTWSAVMCIFCKGMLIRLTGSLLGVEAETAGKTIYGYLAAYKLLFIVFSLAPWLALVVMVK